MADPIRQLLSQTSYVADGVNTVWNFSFAGGYLDRSHVKAFYKRADGGRMNVSVAWLGDYQLSITPPVPAGCVLTVHRQTPCDSPLVDFMDGAQLTELGLDLSAKQAVFLAAEATDTVNYTITSTGEVYDLVEAAKAHEDSAELAAADAKAHEDSAEQAARDAKAHEDSAEQAARDAKGYMDKLLVAMTFPFDFGQITDPVINNSFDLGGL